MRDYYTSYISDRAEKSQKRSESEGAKGAKGSSAPFAPSVDYEHSGNFSEGPPDEVLEAYRAGYEILEERVAIMIYDGGLSEAEAYRYATRVSAGDEPTGTDILACFTN